MSGPQCTAHKRKSASPWGFKGTRFRCPNPATKRATCYTDHDRRTGRFVVCDEHTPQGSQGVWTPTGYRWEFEDLYPPKETP